MPIDELAARRPTWVQGSPVVLADGGTWTLPRPVVVFVPGDDGEAFQTRAKIGDDGTLTGLLKAYDDATTGNQIIGRGLAIGRYLLLLNYDLTTEQIGDLLQFAYGDDESDGHRIKEAVLAVAYGNGEPLPKQS